MSSPIDQNSKHKTNRVSIGETKVRVIPLEGELWYRPKRTNNANATCYNFTDKKLFTEFIRISKKSHKQAVVKATNLFNTLYPRAVANAAAEGEGNNTDPIDSVPGENVLGRWIADTGSGIDLIGRKDIDKEARCSKRDGEKILLSTAGGFTNSSQYVDVNVHTLNEISTPLVMTSTPPVLSIGKRCMEQNYEFRWPPGKAPFFVTPDGKIIKLKVHDNVPYLYDNRAVSAAGSSSPSGKKDPSPSSAKADKGSTADDTASGEAMEEEDNLLHSDGTKDQKRIAGSIQHLMTHYPKSPWCPACVRAKMTDVHTPRVADPKSKAKKPEKFGQHITGDYISSYRDKKDWGIDGQKSTLVLYDAATGWLDAFPMTTKVTEKVRSSMCDFAGEESVTYFYSDGERDLISAARSLGWKGDTSTPHRPQSNGIAEEKVKRVLYSARALLENAGLEPKWWPYAVKAYCMGHNTTGGNNSPYFKRHGTIFQGKLIPFGALVDYLPLSKDGQKRTPQFAPRSSPGIFLGYHLNVGGIWGHSHLRGDYYVAHLDDFKNSATRAKPARHRIRSLHFDKTNISFPLYVAHAALRRTVDEVIELADKKPPEVTTESSSSKAFDVPDEAAVESKDSKLDDTVRDKTLFGYDCEAGRALEQRLSAQPDSDPTSDRTSDKPTVDSGKPDLPDVIPERFVQKEDKPDQPVMYSKAGKVIPGEWINGVFIRYKKDTPRPSGFTTKDWQSIPHKIRQSIIADQKAKELQKQGGTVANAAKPSVPVPAMPVVEATLDEGHRSNIIDTHDAQWFSACVARSVTKREALSNPKAKASLDKEWDKLRSQGCWNENLVREWSDVAAEAKRKGITYHVGRIFDICVEKNAELPEDNPNRKYKGRVVFQGCNVKDESNNWAIFSELSSAPATMQAGKTVDAYG